MKFYDDDHQFNIVSNGYDGANAPGDYISLLS